MTSYTAQASIGTMSLKGSPRNSTQFGLVYFETTEDVQAAIAREKELKRWTRAKRITLIESVNPDWRDLSAG